MPDLRAFANAGFPFSRMADLSESIVVMPKAPNEGQVTTLLDTIATVGAQTGLPAINVTLTDDGSQIQNKDADIMVIGTIPDKLKDDKRIDLLVKATESGLTPRCARPISRASCRMRTIAVPARKRPSPLRGDGCGSGLPVTL